MTKPPTSFSRGVLIVGAGPTGLALANALAHYGVPFTIVDRKVGPSCDSKGLTISLGTQYGLEAIGLKGKIGKHGYQIQRANIYWEGRKFSSINFCNLNLPICSLITQPQPDTERDFLNALAEKEHGVSWNTSLVDIEQSLEGVKATFEDNTGRSFSSEYDYAVGCEGKSSLVRDSLGAILSGYDYSKYLVLGDFNVSTQFAKGQIQYHVYDDTFFILIPIGGDLVRVVVKYDGVAPKTDPVASEITSIVNRYMGVSYLSESSVWLSRAQLYMRTTDRLRKGRLFIAGDAAHLVSPIGGTGFNMGIQDAINLAWKIAFRYREYADDKIFDAYETERLEVIRETVAAADRSTRLLTGSWAGEETVDDIRPLMKNRRHLRATLPLIYSGLGIRYSKCYGVYNNTALCGARRAGEFFIGRDKLVQFVESSSSATSRVSIIVVVYLDAQVGRDQYQYILALSDLAGTYQALSPIVALFNPDELKLNVEDQVSGAVFVPVSNEEASNLGMVAGSMLVVMPDGYIGYSGRLTEAENLEKVLLSILSLKPTEIQKAVGGDIGQIGCSKVMGNLKEAIESSV